MVGADRWTVVTVLAGPELPGWLLLLIARRRGGRVHDLNFVIEKVAYRPLRNAAPGAADHGDGHEPAADAGDDHLEAQPCCRSDPAPSRPIHRRGGHHRHADLNSRHHPQSRWPADVIINQTRLRARDARHGREPARRRADGVKPDMVISATFVIGAALARGRGDVRHQLRLGAAHDGLPARPEGLHRGGVRRHRQPRRAMVGGMLLRLIGRSAQATSASSATSWGSHYSDIFTFITLILVLTLRPQGLLGERVADRA